MAAAVVAAVLVLRKDENAPPRSSSLAGTLDDCRDQLPDAASDCYTRAFLAAVEGREDPLPAINAISAYARGQGGLLLTNCHGLMHTVGRTYAVDAGVTLANLMDYLPQSNDPGCPAGFAHGLVTGALPAGSPVDPETAATACADAGTRYRRYSCIHGFGHAFMRTYNGRLDQALALCRALGADAAADCAQGSYHDYWFAVVGADDAPLPEGAETNPYRLCAAQPEEFVRPCWYRAFLDLRPGGFRAESAEELDSLCAGLEDLQREACMTGAAVIGPPDPAEQLRICADLRRGSDAVGCIRGTKVQNLLGAPTAEYVQLIGRCELFAGPTRSACYRWLGKTITVITDGEFATAGCPQLPSAAREQCRAGARAMDGALETFS